MSTDDHCIVCAEHLVFTAFGACGHKDTCSKCVTRLRSVLKDQRCAYCQQQLPDVFVTRFAGDYTRSVPPEAFPGLKARAKDGELHYLDTAQAYFDDAAHYEEISALCSFSHPLAGPGKTFHSLRALKAHLLVVHKRQLCEICLEGRKVFVGEQLAYSRADLERHQRQGDVDGALAESGFKGHPECRFCHKRYFGDTEIYNHMHSTHEECFLCRRANPHRHVYYRDYPDLESHFRQQHFICENQGCMEAKFVVFATQQELKTHMAREHSQELSRAERRQALTLPVAFNYRRGGDDGGVPASSSASNLAAVAASGQRTVVIGGAASVPSQLSQRRGGRGAVAAAALESAAAAARPGSSTEGSAQAVPASQDQAGSAGAGMQSLVLRESEFPSMVAPSGAGPAVGGRWVGGSSAAGGLSTNDFPALPGTTRSAKRRASKKKTAAEVLGGGGPGVRMLNSGSGSGPPHSDTDHFPVLGAALRELPRDEEQEEWQQATRPQRNGTQKKPLTRPPSSQEISDPTPADAAAAAAPRARNRGPAVRVPAPTPPAAPSAPAPAAASAAASAASSSSGGVSEALRAANRNLVAKVKARLGEGERFAEFRRCSGQWLKGEMTAHAYHRAVAALGLAAVVADLAATCPDVKKRQELLDVHAQAFQDGGAASSGDIGSWMPPEAAVAAAAHAAANASWSCGVCTLANAPAALTCEACGHPRPREGGTGDWRPPRPAAAPPPKSMARALAQPSRPTSAEAAAPAASAAAPVPRGDDFPALPVTAPKAGPSAASKASSSMPAGSGKRGKAKQSLSSFMQSTQVHPQNIWRNPALKGEWASDGAGKMAGEERALNDAWGKKK